MDFRWKGLLPTYPVFQKKIGGVLDLRLLDKASCGPKETDGAWKGQEVPKVLGSMKRIVRGQYQ